jgi:hypothetical protein
MLLSPTQNQNNNAPLLQTSDHYSVKAGYRKNVKGFYASANLEREPQLLADSASKACGISD